MPDTDPNADAFMRRILADPTDPVPRLVFADWLEETGTSSNIAWARYLRLADELANADADDPRRPKLARMLGRISRSIRAKLTFRAETLTAYPDAMLQLLPPRNLVVNVDTVVLKQSLLERVPESIAREYRLLLMGILEDRSYLFAAAEPTEPGLAERVGFTLDCEPVFVGMKNPDVAACLDRNYGTGEREVVESVHYNWAPTDGLRDGPPGSVGSPALGFLNILLLDAFLYVAQALEFETDGTQLTVWLWRDGSRERLEEHTPVGAVVPQLVPLLRDHLRNSDTALDGATRGEVTVAWWHMPYTLQVRIEDRPNGHHVHVSIPRWGSGMPAALNQAA